MRSGTGAFSESTGMNHLGFFFTKDYLVVLPAFIRRRTDASVTFPDVPSTKNKVRLKA